MRVTDKTAVSQYQSFLSRSLLGRNSPCCIFQGMTLLTRPQSLKISRRIRGKTQEQKKVIGDVSIQTKTHVSSTHTLCCSITQAISVFVITKKANVAQGGCYKPFRPGRICQWVVEGAAAEQEVWWQSGNPWPDYPPQIRSSERPQAWAQWQGA